MNLKFIKIKDNQLAFLEQNLIKLIISLLLLFLFINKILLYTSIKYGWIAFDEYFLNVFRPALEAKDSTLITIAAIFIGIYFTLFTLLSSIKIDSTFSILTKDNFERLIIYIRNAFIGSFLYLFFSLFSTSILNEWIWTVVGLTFLLYMLLSAFRFGIIIYLIFTRDLKAFYDQLEKERFERIRQQNLIIRLEEFLDEHENLSHEKESIEFSEKLAERNDKS